MTKDELKAAAKQAGLKVRDSWLDDWQENLGFGIAAFVLGWVAHAVYRIFS